MPAMDEKTLQDFLTKEPYMAKIGSLKEDGSPYVTPVWFDWDGTYLYVITKPQAQLAKNVERDPRVFVCIDRPEWPYMRVSFEGRAEVVDIDWKEIGRRMTIRYMGEQALKYYEERLKYPAVVIRIKPQRMSSWIPTAFPPDRTFFKPARWREVRSP